ncbi:3-mercaptopyruvate sulfurtransferase [Roseovarius sp. C7]|uniref:3-mercaptopyruvate sulfurtransferase n=1 Tax=Roseovarius sp. C7 TaxID=3398643 RepID=UPI0039F723F4
MATDDFTTLVSTGWLADHLKDPDVRVLDGTWHMPATGRDAKAEFEARHIPNARFFDIDDVSDHRSDLPHMVPPVEKFMSRVRALGVGDGHKIVVYDAQGLFSAARVWWLFRLMGHDQIAVLDGGLPKWLYENRPTEDTPPVIRDRHMTVRRRPEMLRDVTQVAQASKLGDHTILDARSAARFRGDAPEPREGLRAGHIPGARNTPYTDFLNADGTMKSPEALRAVFDAAGADLSKPVITTCGSGVTAAVINLALARIGKTDHALYDGSWTEWGAFPTVNVATGDA